jgi:hypothetical protein
MMSERKMLIALLELYHKEETPYVKAREYSRLWQGYYGVPEIFGLKAVEGKVRAYIRTQQDPIMMREFLVAMSKGVRRTGDTDKTSPVGVKTGAREAVTMARQILSDKDIRECILHDPRCDGSNHADMIKALHEQGLLDQESGFEAAHFMSELIDGDYGAGTFKTLYRDMGFGCEDMSQKLLHARRFDIIDTFVTDSHAFAGDKGLFASCLIACCNAYERKDEDPELAAKYQKAATVFYDKLPVEDADYFALSVRGGEEWVGVIQDHLDQLIERNVKQCASAVRRALRLEKQLKQGMADRNFILGVCGEPVVPLESGAIEGAAELYRDACEHYKIAEKAAKCSVEPVKAPENGDRLTKKLVASLRRERNRLHSQP